MTRTSEAELARLIVSPRHRRQGLGRLLIEQLVAVARDVGYREIRLRVFPTNPAAVRCYEAAGFTRIADEQQAALNAAQRFEFVWMVQSEP